MSYYFAPTAQSYATSRPHRIQQKARRGTETRTSRTPRRSLQDIRATGDGQRISYSPEVFFLKPLERQPLGGVDGHKSLCATLSTSLSFDTGHGFVAKHMRHWTYALRSHRLASAEPTPHRG